MCDNCSFTFIASCNSVILIVQPSTRNLRDSLGGGICGQESWHIAAMLQSASPGDFYFGNIYYIIIITMNLILIIIITIIVILILGEQGWRESSVELNSSWLPRTGIIYRSSPSSYLENKEGENLVWQHIRNSTWTWHQLRRSFDRHLGLQHHNTILEDSS